MIVERLTTEKDFEPTLSLLRQIDKTFPIPLSEKTSLDILAKKFLEKGYVYMALDGDMPVGIIGFYANDMQTKTAYISVLGVLQAYRGKGIAKTLMKNALAICKEKSMTSCVLYTHKTNVGAIAMYEKLGFCASYDETRPHDIKFVKKL